MMKLNQILHYREPNAQPATSARLRGMNLREKFKYLATFFGRDTNAIVLDSNHPEAGIDLEAHFDRASGTGVLGGVLQQVADNLSDAGAIARHPHGCPRQGHG